MKESLAIQGLDIWGGIECTINRQHDNFKDQLDLSNHYHRPGDLEAFANLGIKAIRYPVLWEKHCPEFNKKIDWLWAREQLTKIRELNMTPIVGLLHHGSGPSYTSLLDSNFPKLLADYGRRVAIEFPWVEYYTPVNEPLTTARFSGLYGLWFPHSSNEADFLTMLLNQVEGIVLSMQAIRKINPSAKLVQTEDIGKTHSTRKLKYQARFENHRRWITYDLLCGKVNECHPLWEYFIQNGIARSRLDFFLENICVPDIAGFNYYVTSERYLDEHINEFPNCLQGNNGKHTYADNEAVRFVKAAGIKRLIQEGWRRYHIPIAITEAHLHCSREDQLRWFKEIWDCCVSLRKKGIELKAVTAWALLGAYDWDKLLVSNVNNYEVGVFDIKSNYRRPTAMVRLIRSLAHLGQFDHPILDGKGWWHRHNPAVGASLETQRSSARPLLIIGKNGTLGNAFKRICEQRGLYYIILARQDVDITQIDPIKKLIDQTRPWGIINTSGYVHIDNAETAINECSAINIQAPGILAEQCRILGIHFMHFSTDMVFDGDKGSPYIESDKAFPLNMYGKTKLEGERAITRMNSDALIIRSSAFFGPWDNCNFANHVLNAMCHNQTFSAVQDIVISPTYLPDLVNTSLDLFIDEAGGTWHVSNTGSITWYDFAVQIAEKGGYSAKKIIPLNFNDTGWQAERPVYSALASEKGIVLPQLSQAIDKFFIDKR